MTKEKDNVPKVYAAIAKVAGEIAKTGISKSRKNQQQGYAFRGIDEIYNSMAGLLAEHGLVILPNVIERIVSERETKSGGVLFSVTVKSDFSFVCSEDGSVHHVITYGEAMDSADKATNKAMSAAYKYACLQAFCIPTEGDNDADATTHEVAPKSQPAPKNTASKEEVTLVLEAITEASSLDELNEVKATKLNPLWPRLGQAERDAAQKAFTERKAKIATPAPVTNGATPPATNLQGKLERAEHLMAG